MMLPSCISHHPKAVNASSELCGAVFPGARSRGRLNAA